MKKLLLLAALVAVSSLTSCNTAIGMGRDFRQLGIGMENKAHGRTWDGGQPEQQQQDNLPTY
jgi:predicted small secreted protein